MHTDLWTHLKEFLARRQPKRLAVIECLAERLGVDYIVTAVCEKETSFEAWIDRTITTPLIGRRSAQAVDPEKFIAGLEVLAELP